MSKEGPSAVEVTPRWGNQWVSVDKVTYQDTNGFIHDYELIRIPSYTAVLPFRHGRDSTIEVILLRNFRAASGWVLEACKGIGINFHEVAEHELNEETGLQIGAIRAITPLYQVMPMPDRGVSELPEAYKTAKPFVCQLCLAEIKANYEPGEQNLEDEECIEIIGWISLKQAEQMMVDLIKAHEPIDPYTRLLLLELRAKFPLG